MGQSIYCALIIAVFLVTLNNVDTLNLVFYNAAIWLSRDMIGRDTNKLNYDIESIQINIHTKSIIQKGVYKNREM